MGALELDVEELLSRRDVLEATVLASAVPRRSVPVNEQPVREVGRRLFQALFRGPVYGTYRASLGAAQQRDKQLRVVLRLTAPELATLPWEMLFDPETETYLCRREPLVRHVDAPYTADPLEVRPPLRILGLVASPRGLQALDVDAEKDHLAEALATPAAEGLIEVVWVPEATWHGVQDRLLAGKWHVLHFVGHGDFDTRNDEGVLALVGRDGRADMVEASRLADLLGEAQPRPRLVVLNSCSSGQAGANDLFSGTAAALVRSGISAVAAMQFTVSDTAAIAFARGFYTAIAHGRSVDEAARSGRISILGAPGSLEWVTPVLYVRGQATQLFTLAPSQAPGRETPPRHQTGPGARSPTDVQSPEQARRRRAELSALYVAARAELRLEHFDTAIGLFDDLLTLDPGYPGAAGLRETARRGRQLANTYTLATEAEDAGDWIAAARGYGEVLEIDPAYQDAATRKEACQARQKVADLQAELRQHAGAGQWQAVLDVDAELTHLDPSASDPDGLTTRARAALAAEQRVPDLERRYAEARNAEESGDWATAGRGYDEVLEIDPAYQDAATRKEACQARQKVADLQAELRQHAGAGQWQAVLDVDAELTHLDPSASDPDGLTTRARAALAAEQRAADLQPQTLLIGQRVQAVAFSPDGTRLATGSRGRARIWDLQGRVTLEFRIGRLDTVQAVAFSPDGTRLATGSSNYESPRIWDAATGEQQLQITHGGPVTAVAFSPDGTRLATGNNYETARIWDATTGEQQLRVIHSGPVTAVAFSPDGTRLATGSSDKSARIWDATTGEQQLRVIHSGPVTAVAFSPDGTRLATGSSDKSARIWDATTGEQQLQVTHFVAQGLVGVMASGALAPSGGAVKAVAFSPHGTRLATVSSDKTARIWDATTGEQQLQITHGGPVAAVAFSPGRTRLAVSGNDKSVQIWYIMAE